MRSAKLVLLTLNPSSSEVIRGWGWEVEGGGFKGKKGVAFSSSPGNQPLLTQSVLWKLGETSLHSEHQWLADQYLCRCS